MGEPAALFYRPVQVYRTLCNDLVWCRWVAVTRISATPWNDLAAPPGGAFVWDPAARAVQSTVVLCLWVCRLIGKPVHVCRLSPAPNAGLFLGSCRERVCLRGGSCCRVRVRAADEASARGAVSSVIGAPGSAEITLANEGNAALGSDAVVTAVDFIADRKVKLVRR